MKEYEPCTTSQLNECTSFLAELATTWSRIIKLHMVSLRVMISKIVTNLVFQSKLKKL